VQHCFSEHGIYSRAVPFQVSTTLKSSWMSGLAGQYAGISAAPFTLK